MMPPKTRDIICYRHQKMPYKEISRKVGAKEAEKEVLRQEKERVRQEHAVFAFETSKKKEKLNEKGGLDAILGRLSSGI